MISIDLINKRVMNTSKYAANSDNSVAQALAGGLGSIAYALCNIAGELTRTKDLEVFLKQADHLAEKVIESENEELQREAQYFLDRRNQVDQLRGAIRVGSER